MYMAALCSSSILCPCQCVWSQGHHRIFCKGGCLPSPCRLSTLLSPPRCKVLVTNAFRFFEPLKHVRWQQFWLFLCRQKETNLALTLSGGVPHCPPLSPPWGRPCVKFNNTCCFCWRWTGGRLMQIACMVLFAGVDYFVNLVYIGPTLNLTMCPCITFLWWNVCCLW